MNYAVAKSLYKLLFKLVQSSGTHALNCACGLTQVPVLWGRVVRESTDTTLVTTWRRCRSPCREDDQAIVLRVIRWRVAVDGARPSLSGSVSPRPLYSRWARRKWSSTGMVISISEARMSAFQASVIVAWMLWCRTWTVRWTSHEVCAPSTLLEGLQRSVACAISSKEAAMCVPPRKVSRR